MPISIVELGLVEEVTVEGERVHVTLLPTFVGCPALDMIRGDVVAKVGALDGVSDVEVEFVPRSALDGRPHQRGRPVVAPRARRHRARGGRAARGARAGRDGAAADLGGRLPLCGSDSTHLDSPFGPTRCRTIYYCNACRNSFEQMKRL